MVSDCYSKDLDLRNTVNVWQLWWLLSLRLMPAIVEDNFYGLGTIQYQIISLGSLYDMMNLNLSEWSISGRDYNVGVISILVHGVSWHHSGQV